MEECALVTTGISREKELGEFHIFSFHMELLELILICLILCNIQQLLRHIYIEDMQLVFALCFEDLEKGEAKKLPVTSQALAMGSASLTQGDGVKRKASVSE